MKKISYVPHQNITNDESYSIAKSICERLQEKGFEAYFVGGAVRDFVLQPHKKLGEIDIATTAHTDDVRNIFPGTDYVGKAFGVCLVKIRNSKRNFSCFEVATFRKEGGYSDKRHPDFIEPGTLQDDSCRRDFTMNALYFDPVLQQIIDFHNGITDVQNNTLRAVGNADERFQEDALRIVRLFRFSANCSINIDLQTLVGAKNAQDGLALLSKERIVQECLKVFPGCFLKFARSMFSTVYPQSFDKNLSVDFVLQDTTSIGLTWSKTTHLQFPLTSLAIALAGSHSKATERFEICTKALEEWPGTRVDVRMMRAIGYVIQFVENRKNLSPAAQMLRFYRIMEQFRGAPIADTLFFLSAATNITQHQDTLLKDVIEKCAQYRECEQDTVKWMRSFFSEKVTQEIRTSLAKKVSEQKLPPQLIGVWVGLLEGMAWCEGINIPIREELLSANSNNISIEQALQLHQEMSNLQKLE